MSSPSLAAIVGSLPVDLLVAGVEKVDRVRRDRQRVAAVAGDVDGARDVLEHHGCLDRVARRDADRERPVVAHQDGPRPVPLQRLDDAAADRVVADDGERTDRDGAAELVGHAGEHARYLLAAHRPGHGVRRVGVHDTADFGQVPVDVGVRRRVARRRALAAERARQDPAVEVAEDHRLRRELVVGDTGRLDDEQFGSRYPARDVARRPDDEAVPDQLRVQTGHVPAYRGDGVIEAHDACSLRAARRNARSRCITSLPPRPNQSCSERYSTKSRSYAAASCSSGSYTTGPREPMAAAAARTPGWTPAATAAWIADPSAGL